MHAAAEVAAAVGRDFRFDILAQASDLEEDALVRALDELWRRHIVRVQADERWDFSHDRIREIAYSGIGPARARLIHRRIAQGMELLFANRLDDASASIAVHLDRGGQPARSVPFLERAAAVARRVSANEEAIRCLRYALSLLEHALKTPPGLSQVHIYPINGAAHRVGTGDTAFSYRDANFAVVIVGIDPNPANKNEITKWCKEYFDALHPYSAGGAYVNFMMDEGQERVESSFRDNYARLALIKNKYDPTNLFRVNQNIRPAAAAGRWQHRSDSEAQRESTPA
jgi:berberine-like enzyme